MRDLTTRKIVLGLLMGLVLAFGVQGIAEAVQRPTVEADTLIPDYSSTAHVINGSLTFSPPTLNTDNDDKTDEKVTITVSSGLLITTAAYHGESTVTLTEGGTPGLSGFTMDVRPLAAGKQTITVSGTDYTRETSGDDIFSGRWVLTYVYYVTQPAPNVKTATINLANIRNGYKAAVYRDILVYGGDRNHYTVRYTVPTGSTLTYKIPGRTDEISYTSEAPISSTFAVYLKGDIASNVITATVGTTAAPSELSTTGAYFYGQPVLTAAGPSSTATPPDSGSESDPGDSNALLTGAFTATVAGGESATGLAGILVKFEVKDKTSAGGNLVFTEASDQANGTLVDASNKQIWDSNTNTRVTTGSGKILYIRTGSTNAQVDFRLGTAAEQKVTISAVGQMKEVSAFTDVPDTYELSVDEIRDISGKYGLYILAENAGTHVGGGWDVVFTTADGSFEGTGTVDSDSTSRDGDFATPTDGGRRIVQRTNELGIAYVIFDPRGNSGILEVTASIKNDEDSAATGAKTAAQLTFDAVRGASTTRQRDNQQRDDQQVANTISTSPASITGEVGTTQTLTVSAGTATVRVVDVAAFTAAGGSITGTGPTRSVKLPDIAGSNYTITLGASGYTDVRVPVIATAPPANGTLTLTSGIGRDPACRLPRVRQEAVRHKVV